MREYQNREMQEVLGRDLEMSDLVKQRIEDTYRQIGGKKKESNRFFYGTARRRVAAAVVCMVIAGSTVGVMASRGFFEKSEVQTGDSLSYTFDINYDLTPGTYEVSVNQIPDGYVEREEGKYDKEGAGENHGISILPIYNTAELEKLSTDINTMCKVKDVTKDTINGMETDIVTLEDAEKYLRGTYMFQFNPMEGYVVEIYADYGIPVADMQEFAKNMTITRTGDAIFASEDEKQQGEEDRAAQETRGQVKDQLIADGIPQEKLVQVGSEAKNLGGDMGYTVTGYEFLDHIEGLSEGDFFHYEDVAPWLEADGSLKSYTRQHLDADGEVVSEERVTPQFLKVNVTAHCYSDQSDDGSMPLYAAIVPSTKTEDGKVTWSMERYASLPSEQFFLETDGMPIYMTSAENVADDSRHEFFYRNMKAGDEISYTLLYVIDPDQSDSVLLQFACGADGSLENSDSVEEAYETMEDYVFLEN
ncbi:MAG: hypothetical protein MR425_11110 [Lachnospiraceae bacterium]|nr:hypothetical protein [Lachnospiraceae bacterium]